MTTEEDFQKMLDANPEDHQTRMILADFLDDAGDPRAAGYRALGKLEKYPYLNEPDENGVRHGAMFTHDKNVWVVSPTDPQYREHALPQDWFEKLRNHLGEDQSAWLPNRMERKDAEDAAAHAFSKLPPERQAELLGHTTPEQMQRMARARRRMSKITSI